MRIILVVGPSGCGKDSLLRGAKASLGERNDIHFARRYITRAPDNSEDNYFVDNKGFSFLEGAQFFASTWRAHGNCYGIPHHVLENQGSVICSISRTAVKDFEAIHNHVTTIHVTVRRNILIHRLQGRGRENEAEIQKRLERAAITVSGSTIITFDNSGALEQSVKAFTLLLNDLCPPVENLAN